MFILIQVKADYRCARDVRNAEPIPDETAKRRILTVIGRTGAVLGMHVVKDEASLEVSSTLSGTLSCEQRAQVLSVASDICSRALVDELKVVLPQVRFLVLDPVHLPINYEHSHFRKHTPGSKLLRVIMAKFTKVSEQYQADAWGPPFYGEGALPLGRSEERLRENILDHSMSKVRARRVIEHIDGDEPWESTYHFIKAIAALSALFAHELKRRTHVGGVQLRKLLFNATAPSRMHWYFNNQRLRHDMDPSKLALLGSGTSPNEALHAWLNQLSKNQSEWYLTTAEMQLSVNALARLITHNCALYSPTLRQLRHSEVLCRACATQTIPDSNWQD